VTSPSSTPASVRRATPADVDAVAPLFVQYLDFYRQAHDETAAAAFLRDRLERGESVVLVAERAGDGPESRPVGFVQLYPGFDSLSLAVSWVLNDLFVLESARGRGVAAALMEQAEVLAREAGAVALTLETAHDNRVAQRLYERQGYRVDEEYRTYVKSLA
jgi:ribosomal protein S18 acetylase RimI-like enzyme